jgi:hypothetical protein
MSVKHEMHGTKCPPGVIRTGYIPNLVLMSYRYSHLLFFQDVLLHSINTLGYVMIGIP